MAIIHRTTLTPGKLELIAAWLPSRPWYRGNGRPELSKAGGFRLDDPAGEVGLEFLVVNDQVGDEWVTYHVPMTYRAAPLDGDDGLIGTTEHGVLGHRWVYDGLRDPVLIGQLFALLQGRAQPQAQSESNTPDDTVTVDPADDGASRMTGFAPAGDVAGASVITVDAADQHGSDRHLVVRLVRVLGADDSPGADLSPGGGSVTASWMLPDGSTRRGLFVVGDRTGGEA